MKKFWNSMFSKGSFQDKTAIATEDIADDTAEDVPKDREDTDYYTFED